jgi:hypothetical protein
MRLNPASTNLIEIRANEPIRSTTKRQRFIPVGLGSHRVCLDKAAFGFASAHQSRDPGCYGFCAG